MADIVTSPIKFLNATVLSFNTTLGLGSASESSLNVDLIEDCENDPPDQFEPAYNLIEVGAPAYFSTAIDGSGFNFGGILTNWTVSQGGSGKTYNAKVVDPRQLLENTVVIIDSYVGPPIQSTNYFNVYAGYEREVLDGNCDAFGTSGSTERGMPYTKIINKLEQMNPTICSPTGYQFTIDFNSFPQNVPTYYSVPGPSISILQLLQDVCDVLGLEFYVNLLPGGIISIGTIDLKIAPESFSTIINAYNGIATELSYGEELRNEKTKAVIFGEKQHYLSYVNKFEYFFGEDLVNNELVPVVPFANDQSGFWIKKRIEKLNATLFRPLGNGPYNISELDIRAALSSYDNWRDRVLDPATNGSFNTAIRNKYQECEQALKAAIDNIIQNPNLDQDAKNRRIADLYNDPRRGGAEARKPEPEQDLETIFQFVQNLGNTYYGKQWISRLNEKICYYEGENFQEKIFTSVPTNDGGWIDGDMPVIGLSEPELTFFRSDDNRINSFALFNVDGDGNGGGAEDGGTYGESTPSDDSEFSPGQAGEA
jgi:hypothetical protein